MRRTDERAVSAFRLLSDVDRLHELLSLWRKVRSLWVHLTGVFESLSLEQMLGGAQRVFREQDRLWRQFVADSSVTHERVGASSSTSTLDLDKLLCVEGAVEKLAGYQMMLEQAGRGLSDYLDTKRSIFPRLYFLSNDQIMIFHDAPTDGSRIGSQFAVLPHLGKLFEGIDTVRFAEDGAAIGAQAAIIGTTSSHTRVHSEPASMT